MKKIEIPHRWRDTPVFTTEVEDNDPNPVRTALEKAVLVNASLVNASLDGARLDGASLVNARLDGASLVNARLVNASLDGARLDGASLVNASLDGASLDGASLVNASLVNANLDGASLRPIRDDFRAVLDTSPNEVAGLLVALREGRIDGSAYEGECACLVGTIAKVRGCNYQRLGNLRPDSSRPAEIWFLALRPGHTPADHQVATIIETWILEWQAERGEGELIAEATAP